MKQTTKIEWIERISSALSGVNGNISPSLISELKSSLLAKKKLPLEVGPSALFIYDNRKKNFLFIEDSIEIITGFSPDEIINMGSAEFMNQIIVDEHVIPISYLAQKIYLSHYHKSKIENASANLEHNFIPRNGKNETRRMLYIYTPAIWNDQEKPMVNVGRIMDITHLSKMGFPRITIIKNNRIIYQEEAQSRYLNGKNNFGLTKKELEIISSIGSGLNNKDIAKTMNTSIATVYTHRKNIKEKTGKNMTLLINELRERGLIS